MARKNLHIGSSFESWLDEEGIREEATATARNQNADVISLSGETIDADRVKMFLGQLQLLIDVEDRIGVVLREHHASEELMAEIAKNLEGIAVARQLATQLQRELDPIAQVD